MHDTPSNELVDVTGRLFERKLEAGRDGRVVRRLECNVDERVCAPEVSLHAEGLGESSPVVDERVLGRRETIRAGYTPAVPFGGRARGLRRHGATF